MQICPFNRIVIAIVSIRIDHFRLLLHALILQIRLSRVLYELS